MHMWGTLIVYYSCQPFPAHDAFLIVFITQSRLAIRREVVAVNFDRLLEKLILVPPPIHGSVRIHFSHRIRF